MQRIILVGKPNSGKSLLFNQLTGLKQKVANFPGVTVELKSGQFADYQLVDFPGAYSVNTLSQDEAIAVAKLYEALLDNNTALIICNLDATRLESSLVFGLQVQRLAAQHHKAVVFALNMIDELQRFGHTLDVASLSQQLGSPVYAISARTLQGIAELEPPYCSWLRHHSKLYRSLRPRGSLPTVRCLSPGNWRHSMVLKPVLC